MPQIAEIAAQTRSVSPAQRVVDQVVSELEVGRLVPGQRLVEADLCLRYGVGRGPVREALQRLANDGVVEISRNKGARIREVALEDAVSTLEVTELLLGLAARSAAILIGETDGAAKLRQVLDDLRAANQKEEDDSFVRARRSFYNVLLRIGGNKELLRILPAVQVHVVRAQYKLNHTQRKLIDDLFAIGGAVLAGDSVAAESAARKHVRSIRAELESTWKRKNQGG